MLLEQVIHFLWKIVIDKVSLIDGLTLYVARVRGKITESETDQNTPIRPYPKPLSYSFRLKGFQVHVVVVYHVPL